MHDVAPRGHSGILRAIGQGQCDGRPVRLDETRPYIPNCHAVKRADAGQGGHGGHKRTVQFGPHGLHGCCGLDQQRGDSREWRHRP